MAIQWETTLSATQLTLDSSTAGVWDVVQRSAADWEIDLEPNEICAVTLMFKPEATPTEFCKVACCPSADGGTDFDAPESSPFQVSLDYQDSEGNVYSSSRPNTRTIIVEGVPVFRIEAAIFDSDGTGGTDDTASALDVDIRIGTLS